MGSLCDNLGRRGCEVEVDSDNVRKEDKKGDQVFMRGGRWYWLGRVQCQLLQKGQGK